MLLVSRLNYFAIADPLSLILLSNILSLVSRVTIVTFFVELITICLIFLSLCYRSFLHIAKKDLIFDSEHPESLHKLQYLDDASRFQRREFMEEVSVKIKPKFLTQLKEAAHKEGQTAHFEAKLEPITDSNLRVEWYKDGKPLSQGSRFRHIHDFGYVALDIRNLVPSDEGSYTCVATNLLGKDEILSTLKVSRE